MNQLDSEVRGRPSAGSQSHAQVSRWNRLPADDDVQVQTWTRLQQLQLFFWTLLFVFKLFLLIVYWFVILLIFSVIYI